MIDATNFKNEGTEIKKYRGKCFQVFWGYGENHLVTWWITLSMMFFYWQISFTLLLRVITMKTAWAFLSLGFWRFACIKVHISYLFREKSLLPQKLSAKQDVIWVNKFQHIPCQPCKRKI